MRIVYIAGKYRGENSWEVEQNIRVAETQALRIAGLGMMPLCPHSMTRYFDGTLTAEFWLEGTLELLRRCDAVYLCPGWENSSGSVSERSEAVRLYTPVFEDLKELFLWNEDLGFRKQKYAETTVLHCKEFLNTGLTVH